jgi:DNA-binding transcriptional regulator YiaG
LQPYFEAHEIRKKLGLNQQKFAKKLGIAAATLRVRERNGTPTDPVLQTLLCILDRIPDAALRALDDPARNAAE